MIIDAHNHLGKVGEEGITTPPELHARWMTEMTDPFFPPGAEIPKAVTEGRTAEEVIAEADDAGVDMIETMGQLDHGVIPGKPDWFGLCTTNDYVARIQKKYPSRIIGFGSVNPWKGPEAVREMNRCINDLDLYGIKLYPTYEHYRPDNKELMWPIYEKAVELDIPLIIHMACTPIIDAWMEYQHPDQIDVVAREFRDLRIQMAHFGVPWVDECMVMIAHHPNMYADMSFWLAVERPWKILDQLLRCPGYGCNYNKLFWGTDTFVPFKTALDNFRGLNTWADKLGLPKIPEKDIESMLGDNFAKFIRLDEKLKK